MTPRSIYHPPSLETVRDFLNKHKLSGREAAEVIGISPRMWRYYMSRTEPKRLPLAYWYTLTHRITGKPPVELRPILREGD